MKYCLTLPEAFLETVKTVEIEVCDGMSSQWKFKGFL
jgi:hypothetical protein